MPISAVLALSNEQERLAVQQALAANRDIQVAAIAGTPDELEQAMTQHTPLVVILSANFLGAATVSLVERLSAKVPLQVIVLIPTEDFALARQFIRAGAFEALPLNTLVQELPVSLQSAIQRAQKLQASLNLPSRGQQPGHIIVFYGPKGGVGTSLLATNLAVALASKLSEPVALLDLNLQFGAVSMLLNLQPKVTLAALAQRFQGELDFEFLQPFLLTHEESKLKVIAAPSRPELAELVTTFLVEKVLQVLKNHFAFTIVDTSSFLQDTTLAALDAADYIIVITSLDLLAIRNTRLALEMFQKLYPIDRIKLVLNRSNVRFGGLTADQVEDYLKMPVIARIPSDGQLAVTSLNEGMPFVLSAPDAPMSQSIFGLAGTIAGHPIGAPTSSGTESASGVFSRIVRFFWGED